MTLCLTLLDSGEETCCLRVDFEGQKRNEFRQVHSFSVILVSGRKKFFLFKKINPLFFYSLSSWSHCLNPECISVLHPYHTPINFLLSFVTYLSYLVAAKGHPLNFCCFVLDTFKTKFVNVGLLEKCLDVLKPVYRRAYVNWIFFKKEKKTDQTKIVSLFLQ